MILLIAAVHAPLHGTFQTCGPVLLRPEVALSRMVRVKKPEVVA
jgi:hypothetical protein